MSCSCPLLIEWSSNPPIQTIVAFGSHNGILALVLMQVDWITPAIQIGSVTAAKPWATETEVTPRPITVRSLSQRPDTQATTRTPVPMTRLTAHAEDHATNAKRNLVHTLR